MPIYPAFASLVYNFQSIPRKYTYTCNHVKVMSMYKALIVICMHRWNYSMKNLVYM